MYMPITTSAKKALRVSKRKRVMNTVRKDAMHKAIKTVEKMVAQKNKDGASKVLPSAYQAIDKAVKRGIIKANTGARKKARVSALIKRA
jgi:small subunit ribosomal protein S20